ncbi:MAG TPA: iron-containing alcohol dehydrogenase [Solirubrobacterales bacterium]|nr:iron-containing alcohol dehydrogenase [Solirubrobacterales bacterium]
MNPGSFVWRDAGRVVVLREDGVAQAPQLLREHGFAEFELLTTPRALPGAPELEAAAKAVHAVPAGQVPETAAALLDRVRAPQIVALGGGRVIDTAKAVASVSGAAVAAIPTTLSGAEMTGIHRLPAGAEQRIRSLVRPELAIADPAAMTGLAEPALRASAMNALAHGADSLYTPFTNPMSEMAALRGAELIATALDQKREERDRALLAQGAILSGYAIDSGAFAMHHVICQTLVRICGAPHAETNATILPLVLAFIQPRGADNLAPLAEALDAEPDEIEARTRELGGNPKGLGDLGADQSRLDQALESMLLRPELAFTPEPPTREDLAQLVESAW